jgi:hypothetical protein
MKSLWMFETMVGPMWVIIYIYMETTQRISLYSYLYLKQAKTPCFYLLCFFFYKIGAQEGRAGSAPRQEWGRGRRRPK